MKIHSILFSAAGALLAYAVISTPASAAETRKNVLFIAVDDLRPELGCYGNPIIKSPNIDRLAKSGVVFENAFCQQAVCSPSRSSLLTGTRPDTTKVWDLVTHFRKAIPDIVTLPEHFKANGYFTQSMGKIYHHGLDDPQSWSVPSTFPKANFGGGGKKEKNRGPAFLATNDADNALHDGQLADMAVAALGGMKEKNQPFFLAVGFIRPHLPFISPKKYWDLYDPAKIPLAANPFRPKDAPGYSIVSGGEIRSYEGVPKDQHFPDDYARQAKHGYYAAVSYVDAQIGRVIDELDRLGLRESTVIILWGDHGWKLGEHDAWAKHSNVENDTHVPLLVSVPGSPSVGKRSPALVEFVDIYPTLSDLAGLPKPKGTEGFSFKPLLDDPAKAWKLAAFSQYPRTPAGKNLMGYTMRTERYRLTTWVNKGDVKTVDAVELYDHQTDPQENTNIAGDPANKELVAKLTAQWRAGWKAAMPK
ncbi:MAG: iduronate sulfatase [Verrucomicrobiales bacterium VVV1]|nr:MAG: iduronate sulfatase [Verrucomicrobiales bacterium VVV1]